MIEISFEFWQVCFIICHFGILTHKQTNTQTPNHTMNEQWQWSIFFLTFFAFICKIIVSNSNIVGAHYSQTTGAKILHFFLWAKWRWWSDHLRWCLMWRVDWLAFAFLHVSLREKVACLHTRLSFFKAASASGTHILTTK